MKTQRVSLVITLLNFGLLAILLFSRTRPVEASGTASLLRGSGLEIVDSQGKVRSSIQIVPTGPAIKADGSVAKDGKIYPENGSVPPDSSRRPPIRQNYDLGGRLRTDSRRRR